VRLSSPPENLDFTILRKEHGGSDYFPGGGQNKYANTESIASGNRKGAHGRAHAAETHTAAFRRRVLLRAPWHFDP
jgi:hypothetical protein